MSGRVSYAEKTLSQEGVVGVWDFESKDARLGSLYIFLQELACCYPRVGIICIRNFDTRHENALKIITDFSNHRVVVCANDRPLSKTIHEKLPLDYTSRSGSMRWIAQLFSEGKRVQLTSKCPPNLESRLGFDANYKHKVCVHLKNNLHDTQSNANQKTWLQFFEYCSTAHSNITFILVGDDHVNESITNCDNVHAFQGSLSEYFSVVYLCDFFIGMASAFSAPAILGQNPYRIWKHADHHYHEMQRELDNDSQFSFRKQNQRIILGQDSFTSIRSEFLSMLEERSKQHESD